jgi:hypothetical protein
MNKKEHAKAEIRLLKRFLDELEATMSSKTTLGALKDVAVNFGIEPSIIIDFLMCGTIIVENRENHEPFDIDNILEGALELFSFTDEPTYKWADDLRIAVHQMNSRFRYYESGQQEEFISELEREDLSLSRKCEQCGYPLPDKRADAKYCCEACRKRACGLRSTELPDSHEA